MKLRGGSSAQVHLHPFWRNPSWCIKGSYSGPWNIIILHTFIYKTFKSNDHSKIHGQSQRSSKCPKIPNRTSLGLNNENGTSLEIACHPPPNTVAHLQIHSLNWTNPRITTPAPTGYSSCLLGSNNQVMILSQPNLGHEYLSLPQNCTSRLSKAFHWEPTWLSCEFCSVGGTRWANNQKLCQCIRDGFLPTNYKLKRMPNASKWRKV